MIQHCNFHRLLLVVSVASVFLFQADASVAHAGHTMEITTPVNGSTFGPGLTIDDKGWVSWSFWNSPVTSVDVQVYNSAGTQVGDTITANYNPKTGAFECKLTLPTVPNGTFASYKIKSTGRDKYNQFMIADEVTIWIVASG
jgi:hypothetical protein